MNGSKIHNIGKLDMSSYLSCQSLALCLQGWESSSCLVASLCATPMSKVTSWLHLSIPHLQLSRRQGEEKGPLYRNLQRRSLALPLPHSVTLGRSLHLSAHWEIKKEKKKRCSGKFLLPSSGTSVFSTVTMKRKIIFLRKK